MLATSPMRTKSILPVVILILAAALGCSEKPAEKIVATVGSMTIGESRLREEIAFEGSKYDPEMISTKVNFEQLKAQALEKLIQEAMLLNEAIKLDISATSDELKKEESLQRGSLTDDEISEALKEKGLNIDRWREIQKKRIIMTKLIQSEVLDKVPVLDADIESYYNDNIHQFSLPTHFHAKQIIVDSRELAEEILAKLKKGGDFAELAKKHSLSPDGKNGGDLGFFNAQSYPPVFSEICHKLKPGEISDVVETDYGYQIFQLIDSRPARQESLSEAKPYIKNLLAEEKSADIFKKWFDDLRAKTEISVNEKALAEVLLEEKK
ncbi:MAG: Chaperone SurA precursor [bacterium ADurb.Bin270]|nr:MAG: Chaperone SurA precursor [bacterium ADurb.Bin270]HQC50935.1 peptidyl-prolyl cis-trans isomerase [bacterium]HQG13367.1 peptidyl-prolyl cis-trans isomerase [bacterium]HQH81038.1 peptidyl-prolyl cis-trans isomerase [bacterium]